VINKLLKESNLEFNHLVEASPHVFISAKNPLARQEKVTLEDLAPYPCLSFEQGEYNSFHFSEEILSTLSHKKSIRVSDRATLFNLLIGLNGYTISTGVLSADLNGRNIIDLPLSVNETITFGWISHKSVRLSQLAKAYVQELEKVIKKLTDVKTRKIQL
jgi:DNA-binding transcriptional LysR family regulator